MWNRVENTSRPPSAWESLFNQIKGITFDKNVPLETSTLEHVIGLSEAIDPEDIPKFSSPNLKRRLKEFTDQLTLNEELYQEEFRSPLDSQINASAIHEIHASVKKSTKNLKAVESVLFKTDIAMVELQNRVGKSALDEVKEPIQSQVLDLSSRLRDVENTRLIKKLIDFLKDIKTNYGVELQNLID